MIKVMMILLILSSSQVLQAGEVATRFSGANQITFADGTVKAFVGSAFLINHQGKTYGVTAKHVLLETMTQGVETVSIEGLVDQWHIRPFNENTGVVKLGRLINANSQEKLDMAVLQDDWLLFEVLDNESALKPLNLADATLKSGDKVDVFGCNYQNQTTCQQAHYSGAYQQATATNLLVKLDLEDLTQLRGLSGAPVLNSNEEVVGIVSNVIPDEESGGVFFAPFKINPLKKFLQKQ